MKISTFAIRLWRLASLIGFAVLLIYTYVSLETKVAVSFTPDSRPDVFISRDYLFYGCVAIFLINNTLINTLTKLFPKVSGTALPIPNQQLWLEHRDQLNEIFRNWFYSLMAAVNTVMALSLYVLGRLNTQLGATQLSGHQWLLPVCTAIILIVIISLPIRLAMKPAAEE
ncbi:hypothetical protein GCM10028803_56050 [Larkinella knui]|uniref:hypothetical protein n=1 Tax=Larkinella knui TaxID=2025310 RepID=UPI001E41C930|nr:hypothetical protein [Larkinella knui]